MVLTPLYCGLWLSPATPKGFGHCKGGWWGGSGWWPCLLCEKLAHSHCGRTSPASSEGSHNIASTVSSPPDISNIAFSLVSYDWCQMLSGNLLAGVSETFLQPGDGRSDPRLAWDDDVPLILGEVGLGGISWPPSPLVIVGFVFPLHLTFFIRTSFKWQSPSSTPYSVGPATLYLPLYLGKACARGSCSQAADYFQIQFYSLTPK